MLSRKRLCRVVLRIGILWAAATLVAAIGICQQPADDDSKIAGQLAELVAGQAAGKLPRDASFEALTPLVDLAGSKIAIVEGRLTWPVRQRRKLTAPQQLAALASLENLARAGLKHAGIAAERAGSLIAGSEISLVPPPAALSPLDLDYDASEPVQKYLAAQLDAGRFARAEFAALREVIDFSKGAFVEVSPGEVKCRVAIRDPWLSRAARQARALPRTKEGWFDWLAFQRLEKVFLATERVDVAPLAAVIREALQQVEMPRLPGLRLTADDTLAVHAWILPGRYAPPDSNSDSNEARIDLVIPDPGVTGPPGLREALPTASHGSASRTVAGFQIVNVQSYPQVTLHDERNYRGDDNWHGPPPPGPPALVVDQQGFSGAVVNSLAFSPDGKRLAAAGDVLRIWNVESGALEQTVHVVHASRSSGLTSVAWSPDGRHLLVAAAGTRATIRVFDVADFSQVADVLAGHDGFVDRLALSADGRWLVSAGSDQRVYVWDWKTRQTVRAVRLARRADFLSFPQAERPDFLVVDTAGAAAYVSAADVKPAQAAGSPVVQRLMSRLAWPDGGNAHPAAIAIHGRSNRLAIGGWSRTPAGDKFWLGIWPADQDAPERLIKHRYYVTTCAFSPDGTQVSSADGLGAVAIHDVATGGELHRFQANGQALYAVQADADGALLVGRRPRKAGDWKLNWYGQLDHRFDLAGRSFGPVASPRDPAPPVQRQDGFEIRHVAGQPPRLEIHSARGLVSSLPFHDAARWDAVTYGFLQTGRLNVNNPVVLGMESGELTTLDPATLLSCRSFAGHTDRVWSTSESPDLRLLFSASGDGTLRAWPLTEPKNWGGPAAHVDAASRVTHVVPNTSTARSGLRVGDRIVEISGSSIEQLADGARRGNWPFQAGERGTVITERRDWENPHEMTFSNIGDLVQPLYSAFVTPDGKEWVIWTPQGYYDASPAAESWVGWEVDRGEMQPAEFLPLSQFKKKFHRPKAIDELIKTGKLPEKIDLPLAPPQAGPGEFISIESTPLILDSPPVVRFLSPPAALITPQQRLLVEAEVRTIAKAAAEFGRPEIRLLVNGRPMPAARGGTPVDEDPAPAMLDEELVWTIRQTVTLAPGENTIALAATTRGGSNDPAQSAVTVIYRTAEQSKPALDILAIGVGKYQHPRIRQLSFTPADAREFAAAIGRQAQPLASEVRPVVLLDEQATTGGIRKALANLVRDKGQNRTVVLFLAAHGCLEGEDYYLYTHDTDPADAFSSALPWSDLERAITNLAGCRVLLFVDTCHSAAVGMAVDPDRLRERALADDENGVFIFSACAARQESHELGALGHGIFTRAMLDVLGGAPSGEMPRDVRLLEFASAVSSRMEALCRQHNLAGKQELRFMQSKMSKDFVLYRQSSPFTP